MSKKAELGHFARALGDLLCQRACAWRPQPQPYQIEGAATEDGRQGRKIWDQWFAHTPGKIQDGEQRGHSFATITAAGPRILFMKALGLDAYAFDRMAARYSRWTRR